MNGALMVKMTEDQQSERIKLDVLRKGTVRKEIKYGEIFRSKCSVYCFQ